MAKRYAVRSTCVRVEAVERGQRADERLLDEVVRVVRVAREPVAERRAAEAGTRRRAPPRPSRSRAWSRRTSAASVLVGAIAIARILTGFEVRVERGVGREEPLEGGDALGGPLAEPRVVDRDQVRVGPGRSSPTAPAGGRRSRRRGTSGSSRSSPRPGTRRDRPGGPSPGPAAGAPALIASRRSKSQLRDRVEVRWEAGHCRSSAHAGSCSMRCQSHSTPPTASSIVRRAVGRDGDHDAGPAGSSCARAETVSPESIRRNQLVTSTSSSTA